MPDSPLMTPQEVMDYLKLPNQRIVRVMAGDGRLQGVGDRKLFRVTRESVMAYVASGDGKEPKAIEPVVNAPVNPVVQTNEDGQLDTEGQKKRQEYINRKILAKYESEAIDAEITKSEAIGSRDKPDRLAAMEQALKEREDALFKRESSVKAKEEQQAKRQSDLEFMAQGIEKKVQELETACKAKEQAADSYALTKRLEADNLFKARTGEADKYFNDKKLESDKLGVEIIRRQEALTVLNDKIGEAEKQLAEIRKQVITYLGQVTAHAEGHYRQARTTSGNTSAYHDNQANRGWSLQDELKALLRWLGL